MSFTTFLLMILSVWGFVLLGFLASAARIQSDPFTDPQGAVERDAVGDAPPV